MATRAPKTEEPPAMPVVTALPGYETKAKKRRRSTTPDVETAPAVMGRPTDYRPEFVEIARQMYEHGATDVEVAEVLEVSVSTIVRWGNQHSDFCVARTVGKAFADERVVRALYQNAVYGDTTAQIFWLKNRRKKEWRDKQDISLSDDREPQQFDIRRLPVEMREQFRAMMLMMLPPEQRALMAPEMVDAEFEHVEEGEG